MKELTDIIEIIARALVDDPSIVSVKEIGGGHTSILELRVAKRDLGKIIGKEGRTADALRTILAAVSAKINRHTVLDIVE